MDDDDRLWHPTRDTLADYIGLYRIIGLSDSLNPAIRSDPSPENWEHFCQIYKTGPEICDPTALKQQNFGAISHNTRDVVANVSGIEQDIVGK